MNILKQYADSLNPHQRHALTDVRKYVRSFGGHEESRFQPDGYDDVAIRTYLLDCILKGKTESEITRIVTSLEHFYKWLWSQNMILENPFAKFNFKWITPGITQIRHKHDVFLGSPEEREIARLQALNQLGELTNQVSSAQSILDLALETILKIMDLDTAWVLIKAESGLLTTAAYTVPKHGFVLASACNLPQGLEYSNRRFLTRPPACHCQMLFNSGRMRYAVNMVECKRLREAAQTGARVNGLAFHASVPISIDKRTVGLMNFATRDCRLFSSSDLQFLTAAAKMIGLALGRAHRHDQDESLRIRMKNELKAARRFQSSLLPKKLPKIPGMELAAYWRPSLEVSGDYYNVFILPGGLWGFAIADVCGKGAPAALYMAAMHCLLQDRVEEVRSPAELLTHINRTLCRKNSEAMFITATYAILDPVNFQLTYACAGHTKPILHKETGDVEELTAGGTALGVEYYSRYRDRKLKIKPNNRLLFYTDGVTEIVSSNQQDYGQSNFLSVLVHKTDSAKALLRRLLKDISARATLDNLQDDITLLAIGRNE